MEDSTNAHEELRKELAALKKLARIKDQAKKSTAKEEYAQKKTKKKKSK